MGRRPISSGKRAKRDSYHHGNLRAALIDAAAAMLEAHPDHDISLREAARRAGVSPAAPYRHFADKNAMLAAVAEDGFLLMLEDLRVAALTNDADPVEALVSIGIAYVTFAKTQEARFRLMFGGRFGTNDRAAFGSPALANARDDLFNVISGFAASREHAYGAWALMHGAAMFVVDDGVLDDEGEDLDIETILRAAVTAFV